jgi:LPXTG-motif cell wall-anchored protein
MLRQFAGATAAGLIALALSPTVASAASTPSPTPGYPAGSTPLVVSPATVPVGGAVTLTGSGYTAGEPIDITVTYGPAAHAMGSGHTSGSIALAAFSVPRAVSAQPAVIAQTAADAAGSFQQQVRLTTAGTATITASGMTSGLALTSVVTVLPAAVATTVTPKGSLPFTGENLIALSGIGLIVLSLGVLLIVRRRRHTTAAPAATA